MTPQAFLFGSLLALALGAAFHVIRGGGAGRLLFHLLLALVGFWAGQVVAALLHADWLPLGPLALAFTLPGSLLALTAGDYLKSRT